MKRLLLQAALLIIGILLATACTVDFQPAPVSSVTVEERDGSYVALVEGDLPDACSSIGSTVQTVQDSTIKVGLILAPPPEGMMCAQMMTPYSEEVVLDTQGLPPGAYEVDVNGVQAPFEIRPEMQAQPETQLAPVETITIDQRADGNVLMISGYLPDPCHELGDVSQRVEGDAITVDVEMTQPEPDTMCAQVITPFEMEVRIDATREPGQFTVTVNDQTVEVTVQ